MIIIIHQKKKYININTTYACAGYGLQVRLPAHHDLQESGLDVKGPDKSSLSSYQKA
jgi:hypothetical protein